MDAWVAGFITGGVVMLAVLVIIEVYRRADNGDLDGD